MPTSRRNLSVPELLVQSRHYSTAVKKEALAEMLALFDLHPYLLTQHLLRLVSTLSHLISDAAPSLRTTAIAMIRYVFEHIPIQALVGVTTGLILFTISALSSLEEGVRIDALRVLDLLLEKIPEEMVRGWDGDVEGGIDALDDKDVGEKGVGPKVVEGLMGVLRVRSAGLAPNQGGFTSAATGDLSPSSRVAILSTLATFLRAALSPEQVTSDSSAPWYLARSFRSKRDYDAFLSNFGRPRTRTVDCRDEDNMSPMAVEAFDFAFAGASADLALDTLRLPSVNQPIASTSTAPPASLLTLLHPTLLSGFLDTAPAAFAPGLLSFPALERATVSAVLVVARELYARELGGTPGADRVNASEKAATRKMLVAFLGHVGPYFPFGADELGTRSAEASAQLDLLNKTFCSLVSLLVLSAPEPGTEQPLLSEARQSKKAASTAKVDALIENVRDWVLSALAGELNDTVLNAASYAGLEPTLWALVNMPPTPDENPASEVFEGVLGHFSTCSTRGELKPRAFRFVARAVLAQSELHGGYSDKFLLGPELQRPTSEWVKSLGKFLWELNGEEETTRLVLLLLLRLAHKGPRTAAFLDPGLLANLRPTLAPFFSLVHPARGTIYGPFSKVDEQTKDLAMDLVVCLEALARREAGEGGEKEARRGGKTLREAVGRAVRKEGGQVEQRWTALQQ